jgi:hypothetical protein
MDAGVLCNKEMVDLLMRIKRHAKARHGVTVNMSDREVMLRLLEMAGIDDSVLQGMLRQLMALAGADWSQRYARALGAGSGENSSLQGFARKVKESLLKDMGGDSDALAIAPEGGAVRYYRGQPIHS